MTEHIPAQSFECRKWSYRQTKEGVVVSLLIHPNEVTPGLAMAALGTRFMVALVEIGDDEQPSKDGGTALDSGAKPSALTVSPRAVEDSGHTNKPPLSLSSQCALRCKDKRFQTWLGVEDEATARECVLVACRIQSRRDLDTDALAAVHWHAMETRFQHHLTNQMHAGSYR